MALKPIIAGGFYNAGSTPNLSGYMTKAVYDPAGIAAQVAGRTVANTFSAPSAVSAPAMLLNGAIFTGGDGTTTLPHWLIQPAGATAATDWSTSGTAHGINLNVDAGNLADWKVDGATRFKVANTGALNCAGLSVVSSISPASGEVRFANGSFLASASHGGFYTSADGIMVITNGAVNNFDRFCFGAASSAFPSLKRSTTALHGVLADDSGFTFIRAKLQTDTNATTGLGAGLLAATTNATVVIYDGAGQAYRVPCII